MRLRILLIPLIRIALLRSFITMVSIRRFLILTISFFIFAGTLAAQDLPDPDETPPLEEVPIDEIGDPPVDFPPNLNLFVIPAVGGLTARVLVFYFPPSGSTGNWETSPDLENWAAIGTPTYQSGFAPVTHEEEIFAGDPFYIRWKQQP